MQPSRTDKLRQAILFIAKEGEDDLCLGAVKLNKILYYADVRAYLELHKPITGVVYQHLPEGPAPRALVPTRREMLELEEIRAGFNALSQPDPATGPCQGRTRLSDVQRS